MRRVVVLPQPDGPSREKNSPRAIVKVTSSTAATSPNRLVTRSISMTGPLPLPLLPSPGRASVVLVSPCGSVAVPVPFPLVSRAATSGRCPPVSSISCHPPCTAAVGVQIRGLFSCLQPILSSVHIVATESLAGRRLRGDALGTAAHATHGGGRAMAQENFIGGAWKPAASGATDDVVDPATGEVITQVPASDATDVDAAVGSAAEAFEAWGRTTPRERSEKLLALAAA